jgi:uncharacterized delta-60 repeat protein
LNEKAEVGLNGRAVITIRDNEKPISQDISFNASSTLSASIQTLLIQPDGRILAGGWRPESPDSAYLARLFPQGEEDRSFNVNPANGIVRSMILLPDGRILVGGSFTNLNGAPCAYLARILNDGNLDTSFQGASTPDDQVRSIVVQSDGNILIGGNFKHVGGISRKRIARLTRDGALDMSFDPGEGVDDRVRVVALQPDGRVLLAGRFAQVAGVARSFVARLTATGALDASFDPGKGPDNEVRCLVLQNDGKVIIGGEFVQVNDTWRYYLARLNSDGSLDTGFDPGVITHSSLQIRPMVTGAAIEPSGKIIAAGAFNMVQGARWYGVARFETNGLLDRTLNPGRPVDFHFSNPEVILVPALQPDGRILLGGSSWSPLLRLYSNTVSGAQIGIDPTIDPMSLESESFKKFVLWRSGNLTEPSSVRFSTADGTALAGQDYESHSSMITFAPLETEKEIAVSLTDDTLGEADEAFQVNLEQLSSNCTLGLNSSLRVRILDDERPGSLDLPFCRCAPRIYPGYISIMTPAGLDGRLLLGGEFFLSGDNASAGLCRLNADGTFDPSFGAMIRDQVTAVAVLNNGQLLASVAHRIYDEDDVLVGIDRKILRLLSNGQQDSSYTLPNWKVALLAAQTDGKVVCYDEATEKLRWLDSTGTVDATFNPVSVPLKGELLTGLVAAPDGVIWMAFGRGVYRVQPGDGAGQLVLQVRARLNPCDGIRAVAIQPDHKLLVAGDYMLMGASFCNLVRLDPAGTIDPTFHPPSGLVSNPALELSRLLVQPDGKILVLGNFQAVEGLVRGGMARLHSDGRFDPSFDPGDGTANGPYAVCQQLDGKFVLAGHFWTYNHVAVNDLIRLNGDPPLRLRTSVNGTPPRVELWSEVLPAHPHVLQASSDLNFWSSMQTNVPTSYQTRFEDTSTEGVANRFYRLLRLPP